MMDSPEQNGKETPQLSKSFRYRVIMVIVLFIITVFYLYRLITILIGR